MSTNGTTAERLAGRYYKYSLWVVAASALFALLGMNITGRMMMVNELVVCVVFTFIVNILYGMAWRAVAKSSPSMLTRFYLTAPVLRMAAAALVLIAYCLINKGSHRIPAFAMMFFAFYVVMLVFDVIFFARVEKKNKIKE